jgi:lysophospholipase L1-like esterase
MKKPKRITDIWHLDIRRDHRRRRIKNGLIVPAPVLLPLHARIVFLGDSITAARGFAGFADWALFHARGRYHGRQVGSNATGPTGWNQGVVGNTTAQMIARLSNVSAESPKVVVIKGGTNDITNSNGTFSSVTTNLRTLIDACKSYGAQVVLCTIVPGSSSVYMAGFETIRQQVNAWIMAQTDVTPVDTSSKISSVSTHLMVDGKHPNGTGAQAMGYGPGSVGEAIANLISADDILYSPPTAPAENMFANPFFTGGTTTATSWSFFNNSNGLTKAASKTTIDGETAQRFVASGTANTGNADNFNQNVTATGGVIGDRYEAWVEIEITKAQNLAGIALAAGNNNSGFVHFSITAPDRTALSLPFRGVLRTPPVVLTSNGQVLNARLSFLPSNGQAHDIDIAFRRAGFRKVPSDQ